MEKGTIAKIFGHYFGKAQFREGVLEALREFFNQPNLSPGKELKLKNEDDERVFKVSGNSRISLVDHLASSEPL